MSRSGFHFFKFKVMSAYKLSYYLVVSEIIEENTANADHSTRLIFASRSSSLLTIKEKHYKQLQAGDFETLPEALLSELKRTKTIVDADENELQVLVNENKDVIKQSTNLHYVIMPSAYCQLGCDYCGQEHAKAQLSNKAMDAAESRIEHLLKTGKFQSLEIHWFGAEPLVGINQIRVLAPRLIALAERYNCRYWSKIVTNGLALKESIYEELVHQYQVKSIEITLDGTAEFHDTRRYTKSKDKTFDIIFNNILKITARPEYSNETRIVIRCNADERNVEGVVPLIELLAAHNLQQKIFFYIAPVYSWGNDAHLKTPVNDFALHEIDWYLAMHKHKFPVSALPGRVYSVCTSVMPHDELMDSYGNIYNCTEVPMVPAYDDGRYQIGHVSEGDDKLDKKPKPFLDWNDLVLNKDKRIWCWGCKIFPVCGGRCPKNWMENIPPCPVMKFNMEDRMALTYYLFKEQLTNLEDTDSLPETTAPVLNE